MKVIKIIFIFLIFNFFILINIYSTEDVEDPIKKMDYIRYFLSNSKIINIFIDLSNKNFKWIEEYILFGSLVEDKYFYGQIQFAFCKNESYKSIIIDFIEYRSDNKIEIKDIYITDGGSGGFYTK